MDLITRNNIKKGDRVLWSGGSAAFPRQNGLANKILKKGKAYVVEFVFPGSEELPEQIELDGIEELFVCDMFHKIPSGMK